MAVPSEVTFRLSRDAAASLAHGKTVWAEVKAPDLVPAPAGREVAAVTVRPGQSVRAWGAWHTSRSVRGEQLASGDHVVVLGLGEGPALRLHASKPFTVRDVERWLASPPVVVI